MAGGFDSGLYRTFRNAPGALDTKCDLTDGEIPQTRIVEATAATPLKGIFGVRMPQPIDRFVLYLTTLVATSQPNSGTPPVITVRVRWGYNDCNVTIFEKDVALTAWNDAGWIMSATGLLVNSVDVSCAIKTADPNVGRGAGIVLAALVDRCGCCEPVAHNGPFVVA